MTLSDGAATRTAPGLGLGGACKGVGLGVRGCGGWHSRLGWQVGRGRGCMLTW